MKETEEVIEQLNALVEELENYPDEEIREKTLDLVQIILSLHGDVLRRILTTLNELPIKDEVFSELFKDELIRSVLLVHGLMPEELKARVAATLEKMRPLLVSQGCHVEIVDIQRARARLRLVRSGQSLVPIEVIKQEIEKALGETAPDLLGVEIEDVSEQVEATARAAEFLGSLISKHDHSAPAQKPVQIKRTPMAKSDAKWLSVIRSFGFKEGQFEAVKYDDINLLICKIEGEFCAFRNACAESGEPFDGAAFDSPMLSCRCHGYRYDLSRRGICSEKPDLKLQSLPVKVEEDKVKVAW